MKSLALGVSYAVLYTAVGGGFLWISASQRMGFYALAGLCFLALAVWEGRTTLRDFRAGRTEKSGWPLTMNLAYIILALCYVARSIVEPTGFNVGLAVCWAALGAAYAVKAVREFRAAGTNKEEVEHE